MKRTVQKSMLLFVFSAAIVTNTEAQLKKHILPYLNAALGNKNVYGTKTEIVLKKTYQISTNNSRCIKTGKAVDDTCKYILKKNTRYKILEETDNGVWIRLLPCLRFDQRKPIIKDSIQYYMDTIINSIKIHIRTGKGKTVQYAIANDSFDIVYNDTCNICADSDTNPTNYYFRINPDDITPNNHYLISETLLGMPITLPVKIRNMATKPTLEAGLSLGYAFGWRVKANKNPYHEKYFNIIPAAFSVNEDGYFKNEGDDKTEAVSLTYYSFGLTYEYYGFNIGVFRGWDRMFGSYTDWVYQKKGWVSLGIGYKFGGGD